MSKLFWLCAVVLFVAVVFFVTRAFTVPNGDFMTVSNEEFARIIADTDSVDSPSNSTERENSECGHTGVIKMQSICGEIMGPPAESEYAVEPVGVAKSSPSARYFEISSPFRLSERSTIFES